VKTVESCIGDTSLTVGFLESKGIDLTGIILVITSMSWLLSIRKSTVFVGQLNCQMNAG
jgi:hypothetical protein